MQDRRSTRNFSWSDQNLVLATDVGLNTIERQTNATEASFGAFEYCALTARCSPASSERARRYQRPLRLLMANDFGRCYTLFASSEFQRGVVLAAMLVF